MTHDLQSVTYYARPDPATHAKTPRKLVYYGFPIRHAIILQRNISLNFWANSPERSAFVLDHRHVRRDVTCKPAVREWLGLETPAE